MRQKDFQLLLVVTAAALAFAGGANVTAPARPGWIAGPQPRTYLLADRRDMQEDESAPGQFGASGRASGGVNRNDDDDRPRVRRQMEDRTLRERIDRGEDRVRDRDDERLRGRNFRD
jgi:hypothetical protein